MQQTITSKLFFFNSDTDYLPYYKNYTVTINEDLCLADLLQAYATQIRDYTLYPIVKVNGKIDWEKVDTWIEFYRTYWEDAFDKLDDYLIELQKGDKKK